MTETQFYNFDLPKGGDIIDFMQENRLAPVKWDGLKSLAGFPRKKRVRKKLATAIRTHAEDVPEEWVNADPWLNPDLSIQNTEFHAPPKLPRHLFGDFWGNLIQWKADASSAPEDYTAIALLVTVGGLIGNTRRAAPTASWHEPPIIWGAIIGKPGTSKTPAQDSIQDYIVHIEKRYNNEYEQELTDWKLKVEQSKSKKPDDDDDDAEAEGIPPKPVRKRIVIHDATVEIAAIRLAENPKGLICNRDELAGLIGAFGRYSGKGDAERSFWLQAFNGRPYKVDRVGERDEPLLISHMSISILGGTQPEKLNRILLSGDDDGLAARFFYVWPERTWFKYKKDHFKGDDKVLAAFERLAALEMASDTQGNAAPIIVTFSLKARKRLFNWAAKVEKRHDHHTGMIAGHFAKYRGMAVRIALILEYLWWACQPDKPEPDEISLKAIKAAIEMLETYFEPMAIRSFADAGVAPEQRHAASLAKWIMKGQRKMVNARALYKEERIDGLNDAATVKVAINVLIEAGWLRPCPSRDADNAGRMRSDYDVNPLLYT